MEKAYLLAASYSNVTIANGDVTLNGRSVSWFDGVTNDAGSTDFFHSVIGNVTRFIARRMDGAPAGCKRFKLAEVNNNTFIDGEILVVVFRVPGASQRTVALLFGGQQLAGDRFEITLSDPFDRSDPNAAVNMGLGVSYGCQYPPNCASAGQQYSIVNVNGVFIFIVEWLFKFIPAT